MFRKILISFLLVSIVFSFGSTIAFADKPELIGGTVLPGVDAATETAIKADSTTWVQNVFLKSLIDQAIGWTAALAVIFLIIGGYQYLTSIGNEEQIKTAHKTMIWSIAGLLLALFSFAIVQILVNINFDAPPAPTSDLLSADAAAILPFAEDDWMKGEGEFDAINNLPTADFKKEFLPVVARFLIYAMAFIAAMVFTFSGVSLANGWGEEESIKRSKNAMIWAATGLAFAGVSYIVVKSILGINFESDDLSDIEPNYNQSSIIQDFSK